MITWFSILRSKLLQFVAAVGLFILVVAKLRAQVREDAFEDAHVEMEKRDEVRAEAIRDRVAAVRDGVRPSTTTDDRGYRD